MEQRKYWNDVAEKKEFTTDFQMHEFEKYVERDSLILDVGCGYGRTLNELQENGYKNLIGVDFSNAMIEKGNRLFPKLDLRVMESKLIDMSDESCDAVILVAVLTCIIDDEEQLNLLREIKRVLKRDGIIYINDFLLNTDERNLNRYKEFADKFNTYGVFELPEGAIVRHHSTDWVKESTKEFTELSFQEVVYTTMNGNKSNGYYYLGRKVY